MNEEAFQKLRQRIIRQFPLGFYSIHGPEHWARVEQFGLRLASETGADLVVVRLFSIFHDSRRENEGFDDEHGPRGAELALKFQKSLKLEDERLAKLVQACREHTGGMSDDVTIGTCFDADRLDLYRPGVHLFPDPELLNTEAAKRQEMIDWATGVSHGTQRSF